MATIKTRIAPGFPFPVVINETSTGKTRIAPGVVVNEKSPQQATGNTGQFLVMFG